MVVLCLILAAAALGVSLPACWLMLRLGRSAGAHDTAPIPGQLKEAPRAVPNTGGVGIALGILAPILAGLAVVWIGLDAGLLAKVGLVELADHLPGIREQTPMALGFVACLLWLHILGLIDDRRPLGPLGKLVVMLVPAVVMAWLFDTRLLELLDARVGGQWLSIAVTVVWFVVITNAMNFIDNMDGLAGGVAAIAGACFCAAALINGQWFVAAVLALVVGSAVGFLVFNFPRARLFMGDSGSLVLGFALAFLTVRTTYFGGPGPSSGNWYGVLMPLVVLAIPLYDFASVTLIRLSQGRSPLVGDLSHLSHRLVRRGMSKPAAVVAIWMCTLVTGLIGIMLGSLPAWQALLAGAQVVLLLCVLALIEWGTGNPSVPHET